MKIKVKDIVKVMRGKDRGQTGEVLKVNASKNQVLVKDINKKTKHKKPTSGNPGEIIIREHAIDASNVMLVCPTEKKPTRVGYKKENGKSVRISKKSGKAIAA